MEVLRHALPLQHVDQVKLHAQSNSILHVPSTLLRYACALSAGLVGPCL